MANIIYTANNIEYSTTKYIPDVHKTCYSLINKKIQYFTNKYGIHVLDDSTIRLGTDRKLIEAPISHSHHQEVRNYNWSLTYWLLNTNLKNFSRNIIVLIIKNSNNNDKDFGVKYYNNEICEWILSFNNDTIVKQETYKILMQQINYLGINNKDIIKQEFFEYLL